MTDSETWRYHTTTGRRGGASTVPRLLLCVGSAAVLTRRWFSVVFHAEQNCSAAPIEPCSSRRYFCHLCVGVDRRRRASEEELGRSGRVLSVITIQSAGILRPPLLVVGLLATESPTRYSAVSYTRTFWSPTLPALVFEREPRLSKQRLESSRERLGVDGEATSFWISGGRVWLRSSFDTRKRRDAAVALILVCCGGVWKFD